MAVPTLSEEVFDIYKNSYNLKGAGGIADEYGCFVRRTFTTFTLRELGFKATIATRITAGRDE